MKQKIANLLSNNFLWVIIIAGLIALAIWQWVSIRAVKNELKDKEGIVNGFIIKRAVELASQKKQKQLDSLRYEKHIDSATALIKIIEIQRTVDFNKYQNKLNALSKVNTYNSRVAYLDSLERAKGFK